MWLGRREIRGVGGRDYLARRVVVEVRCTLRCKERGSEALKISSALVRPRSVKIHLQKADGDKGINPISKRSMCKRVLVEM